MSGISGFLKEGHHSRQSGPPPAPKEPSHQHREEMNLVINGDYEATLLQLQHQSDLWQDASDYLGSSPPNVLQAAVPRRSFR